MASEQHGYGEEGGTKRKRKKKHYATPSHAELMWLMVFRERCLVDRNGRCLGYYECTRCHTQWMPRRRGETPQNFICVCGRTVDISRKISCPYVFNDPAHCEHNHDFLLPIMYGRREFEHREKMLRLSERRVPVGQGQGDEVPIEVKRQRYLSMVYNEFLYGMGTRPASELERVSQDAFRRYVRREQSSTTPNSVLLDKYRDTWRRCRLPFCREERVPRVEVGGRGA